MKRLLLILAAALPGHAATMIEIAAKFADVPAGTFIASGDKLEKIKGVNVLSAPKVVTGIGQRAVIEITQSQSAPGGVSVPLGVALEITPSLDEKSISYSGKATDRAMHGKRSEGSVNVVEFATREVYFSGATNSGQTVLIQTAPAVAKGSGKAAETTTRELVIVLTFSKKTTEEDAPKKTPTKSTSTKPAPKKPATSKITPEKKKK